jgi:hypothetical protein
MTKQRSRIVKAAIVVVIILALMLTMHVLVNNLDILSFMRKLHGG